MHTLTVLGTDPRKPLKGRDWHFPGGWAECDVNQLGRAAALLSVPLPTDVAKRQNAEMHLRLQLLKHLSGIPEHLFNHPTFDTEDLIGVQPDALRIPRAAFLPQLDWALTDPVWDKSLVPELRHGKKRWVGPTDRLANFTVLRWGFCDALLERAIATTKEEDLNNLLAALYTAWDEPWSNKNLEQRGREMARLAPIEKLAAVMNYRGLRGWLVQRYAPCFKGGERDPDGIQGMIVRLAGPKFGSTKKARHADLHDVLVHVRQTILDAEQLESQRK